MICIIDKDINEQRKLVIKCKNVLKSTGNKKIVEYKQNKYKFNEIYVNWALSLTNKINDEINCLTREKYIRANECELDYKMKEYLSEIKSNLLKKDMKNKELSKDISKNIIDIDKSDEKVLEHNLQSFSIDVDNLINTSDTLNNLKEVNRLKEIYINIIMPFKNTETSKFDEQYYNLLITFEVINSKYRNKKDFIRKITEVCTDVDIKFKAKDIIEAEYIFNFRTKYNEIYLIINRERYNIKKLFNVNEVKSISSFKYYYEEMNRLVIEHNQFLFNQKGTPIAIDIINNIYKKPQEIYCEISRYHYIDLSLKESILQKRKIHTIIEDLKYKKLDIEVIDVVKQYIDNFIKQISLQIDIHNSNYEIMNLYDEIDNKLKSETIVSKEDISDWKNTAKRLLYDIELYQNKLNHRYSKFTFQIIDKIKYYIQNIDYLANKHNTFVVNKLSSDLYNNILERTICNKNTLFNTINNQDFIDIKLAYELLKVKEIKEELIKLSKENTDYKIRSNIEGYMNNYLREARVEINRHNINHIKKEKEMYTYLFDNIEGKVLDQQQVSSILTDEYNNLVIAGAGCGKTTTILGKILYLLEKELCKSDEILVISFTNATSDELKDRIIKLTKEDIQVTNFHKLGLNIIRTVDKKDVKILKERYNTIVNIVYTLSKNKNFREKLKIYITQYYSYEQFDEEFNSFSDYVKYYIQRKDMLYTIKGERVKSFEEKQIANYLYINGIEYEYEKKYKYNTTTETYKNQYKPDFYLPEYDIYIEHFGVNKYGQPPEFYSAEAKYKYIKGMEWKQYVHKDKNTNLISTYSWEYRENILLRSLEYKLNQYGVKFDRLTEDKLKDILSTKLKDFLENIERIINIIKIQDKKIDQIMAQNEKLKSSNSYMRNKLLLEIIEEVYYRYSSQLAQNNQIDFADMIKKATSYLETRKYTKEYKYIIIDEYQDISIDRVKLIKGLREIGSSKLFCVGDDWQSIYGFAGSDVNLFTEFEKIFGYTEKSKIENTYRFGKDVIALSEKFVQANEFQIKKELKNKLNQNTKVYIRYYDFENKEKLLDDTLGKLPINSSVLLLDRYNEYIEKFKTKQMLDKILDRYKHKLDISYKTIHQSKGLEADYVIVLNNTDKIKGFPSKIENEGIIDLLLEKEEKYPYEEERRLFYVAMTRCKKGVLFFVEYDLRSEFIMEIESDSSINIDRDFYEEKDICPKCFSGNIIEKYKDEKTISICSNYPICNYT